MRLRAALAALLLALPLVVVGSGPAHATESPLTASFVDVPVSHDGRSAFSFELSFSEPVSTSYATLRDDSLSVVGGSVTQARRVDGRSDRWQITVAPDVPTVTDAVIDVSIELAATPDCDDQGAVCTADDVKALSNTTTATVAAPPPLVAEFESVPSTHDSSAEFSFRLRFNTAVTTSYRVLGSTAFDVTGGTVSDARRIDRRSDLWQITIQPDAVGDDTVDDDISITLPATEDCGDAAAVCTAALRPLSEPVTAAVEGPLVETGRNERVTREIPGDKEDENRLGVRAAPSAPTGVTAAAGNKSLFVRWSAVTATPAVTGYKVQYRVTGTSTWTEWGGTIAGAATSETVTGLTEWVSYDVQVLAVNDDGDGAWSAPATGTPNRDFGLEDQSTGLWSDGTTIWAAQEGLLAGNSRYRVDAYVLDSGARDSAKDFSPSKLEAGLSLGGLCSNGGTWWVIQGSTARAYTVADASPDIDQDISVTKPHGLWCSTTQLLAVNWTDGELNAYSLPDRVRDQDSDVTGLTTGSTRVAGVWTDEDTVWVSDPGEYKVYAYGLADSRRRRGLDIDGLGARGNNNPYGIWSDGSTMWVVDRRDDKVYSYRLPQPADGGPEAWSAAVSADGATAIVVFDEPLDTNVTLDRNQFSVKVGSESATPPAAVSHTSGNNKTVTLTLPSTADEAEAVTIDYTDLSVGDDTTSIVQDSDGVDLATFTGLSATPRAVTAPGAPTGLSATPRDGSLTVSWAEATTGGSPTSYGVRHRETADPDVDGSYMAVMRTNAAATSEVISGLVNGTDYTVQVNAANTAGTSTWVSVTGTPAAPAALSVPQSLSFASRDASLVLAWAAPNSDGGTAVTNYVVQYRVKDAAAWTTWPRISNALVTGETITGLTNYTVYEVQVAARNGDTDAAIGPFAGITQAMPAPGIVLDSAFEVPGPTGLWSDGMTMWVLNSAGAHGYVLSTGARDSSPVVEFDTANPDQHTETGMCSNGTTTWVANDNPTSDLRLYAYEHAFDDGTLAYTSGQDIDTGNSSYPRGVWCDEDQLLVAVGEDSDQAIRAYDLPSRTRNPARDIPNTQAAGIETLRGVWSDGLTVWVSDANLRANQILAFSAFDAQRREWLDIADLQAIGAARLRGIWSDDTHIWVVESDQKVVFKLPLPQYGDGPPVPRSAEVSADGTTVKVTFTEALATDVEPAAERFEVRVGSVTVVPDSVAHTSGDDTSVTLTLPDAAGEGVAATVAYNDPDDDQTDNVVQDAGGADAPSFTKLSATPRAVTAPGAPTGLMAAPGNASLTVSWSRAATGGSPAFYRVRHRETADPDMDGSYTTVMRANAAATSETIGGLTNGTGYTVQVQAVNTAGTSAWAAVTGTPAVATGGALISNFDQESDTHYNQNADLAQRFTTGPNDFGYSLSSVEVESEDLQNDEFSLSVCTVDDNGFPTSTCTPFAVPAVFTSGILEFTAPAGTVLAADTTYTVLLEPQEFVRFDATTSDAEDTGGGSGWSIADQLDTYSTSLFIWAEESSGISIRIAVKGNILTTDTNTAPRASDGSVTTIENTAYIFTADDFNFVDTDAGDALEKVKIVMLPRAGTLELDGTTVTENQEIAEADIDAGNLVFTPATDATGDEYATFTFKVNDGDNESASAYTMTVNVREPGSTLISNFKQGSNNNVNTNVTAQRFTTGSSADGYELNSVEVISQDIQGDSFSLSVCTVDGDGFPTDPCTPLAPPSSFAKGTRVFVTPADMILAADTTYTVLLSVLVPGTFVSYDATDSDNEDTGGYDGWSIADSRDLKTTMWFEANTGVSIRINVKGNAVPTASHGSVTTAENTAYAFAAEDFNFVDVDDGDELEKVKIVTLPTDGTLELDDTTVTENQEIAKADIDAGELVFTPAADGTGDEYATFMFKVNDGKSEGTTEYTMTVEVRETGSTLISNFGQGSGVIFHNLAAALGFTTGPSADGYVLNSVEVESEDLQGDSFSLSVCTANSNGLPTSTCTTLTPPSSFRRGTLVFVTPADMILPADARYAVVLVSDESATLVNWAATSSDNEDTGGVTGWSIGDDFAVRNSSNRWAPSDTGYSFRINVKGNAIPTASDGSVTTDENTAYVFALEDFNFVDANTADALERVKIVTLPADGRLALAGTAVAVNQEMAKADIDAGELVFTPVADGNGEPYATFTFKVNDGEIEGTSTYSMTVNVTAFIRTPSAPTGVHVSGTLGSITSVDVGWTVPEHIDKPAITGYKLQYRESDEADWLDGPQAATGTSSTIASLGEDTTYEVQVLAFNDAGDGTWSSAATGRTNARQSPYNLISNLSLGGSGYIEMQGFRWSQGFTTGPESNGYKLANVALRIARPSGSTRGMRVRLYTDDNGVPDDKIFTFTNPSTIPPGENDLVFAAPSGTRLDPGTKYHVELAESGGSGPHLRFYRTSRNDQSGETGFDLNNASKYWNGAEWLDHVQQRAGYLGVRGATIANDMPYITEVEVEDAPGDGLGYETGDEITVSVTFSEAVDVIGEPRFPLRLNTGFEQAVYSRSRESDTVLDFDYTVAADHHDGNGFEIWSNRFNRAGGAIKRAGSTVDADLDKPYRSTGPDYTINATSVPTGVHVSGTVGSTTSVDVGWTAPDNTGRLAITGYKLQYREAGETDWVNGPQDATGTYTTIASLTADTAYEVQVLASRSESDGAWSATATGRTNEQQTETALVSNFTYSGTQANIFIEGTRWSQGFDTGTNSSGYKLENVKLKINRGSNSTRGIRVRLYTNDNGEPDSKIFTFTNPSTIPTGLNDLVFTAPSGTRLAPSTKYHVVFERYGGSGNDIRYRATSENGQTGISGFEIDDAVRFFNNFDWINQTNSYTAYLRVTGATIANDTPYITDVEIEDAPGDGFGYETGDEITVSVTFSEAVDVIGEPRFPLRFNTGSKQAVYSRSRESNTVLDFDYTVAADDHDSDGFVIWSDRFNRAGGAIKRAGSTVDADLDKPFRSPGSDYTINATSATDIEMESGPSLGEFYTVDDHVEFKVTFSGAVDVTGTPQFAFCMNNSGQDCNETQADYNRGSGTTELIFRYVVQAADSDTNGVFIEDKPLTLNSGTITKQGDSTRNANLVIDGPGTQGGHKVYGGPLVSSVAVTSQPRYSDDTYTLGEDIEITVTFTEAVDVEGDPVFRFNLANSGGNDDVDVGADYESGSGTDALMFAYEVQAEDNDSNGLWIGYQDRTFNLDDDDSIEKTSSDVDALLTHDRPGTQSDHKVKTSDNPPKFPSTETGERSVAENSPAGTAVGAPFTATDPDSGAMLVFSLGGDDAASFTIDSSSGQISTKPGVTYDYEGKNTYSLTASVTDGTYTDTIDVTITLTDIANETDCAAPTYTGDLTQIWMGELTVGSFEASSATFYGYNSTTDPDTGALSDTTVTVTTEHTVESVSVGSGTQAALLAFKFTDSTKPALSVVRKLMLYACDKGFAMGGFVPGGNGSYTLANSRLDWSSETPLNLYIAIDDDVPELQTAEVADSTLVLTFNEDLDKDATVPVSAFAVTVAGTAAQPSSVAVDGAKVTLMLATPVTEGQTVTLTYTKQAGTPRVRDVFTNEAAALTDRAVVNNTAATPSAPTGVHVSGTLGSTTSVDVGWTAPVNTDKPAITGYKLQYRESGETDWIDGPQDATGTSSVIASLTANTVHEVQVRAFNSEGDGTWSSIASGRTNAVQSATTLVSNFSEENPFEADFEDFRWSQGFTTGSQSNGYELQNVALKIIRPSGSTRGITVRLYTDDNEDPGDSLFTFTNPSTMPSGPNDIVFTAPSGTRLDPATKYHVVFQRSGGSGADLKYRVTSSNSQDGETGFGLADSEQYFNGSVWVNHAQMNAVYLRVRGAIATDMPYVTDVEVEDAPADSLGYETGEEITVSVTFSEAVDVIGNPRFPLQLNTESKQAVYSQSRESDTVLDFNYTVAADDHDSNGFEILSDLFDRNGGAIKRAGSTVDADLDKPFRSPGSDYTVNATSATDIEMESAPSLGEFYTVGDHVEFKVTFSGAVDVTGTPQFAFCMNNSGQDCNETQADYNRGSGTTELIFRYEVQAADSDTNGVFIEGDALSLNSGTITTQGDSTRSANLALDGPGTQSGHKVYGGPLVSSVAVTSQPRYSDDTYTLGEDIEITVTFSEAVDVESDPVFRFNLMSSGGNDDVNVNADYDRGSGTDTLVFAYEVQAEDNDSNGLWIGDQGRTFDLDSDDSIEKTSSDVDALLTHSGLGTQENHKVKTSDNPPKFPSTETGERSVAENSPAGTAVGAPFTATDDDSGATLVFSLGGDDAASFTIGSSSGQISTKTGVTYDYEVKSTYSLTVSVTDGTYTDTVDVTITLTDIDETDVDETDATLSALTLMHGSTSVSLSPTFASGTTEYQAWVANGVSEVTVTATKNDDEASVAITDDTDTSTPNTAVQSLAEGANTVTVTVTARDNLTTGTYEITAVREASAPTADPTALMTAKMTVAQDGTNDIYGYRRTGSNYYGALTGNEFDFDGTTYTITNLFWNGPDGENSWGLERLILCFNSLPEDSVYNNWTLRIGNVDYSLDGRDRIGTSRCVRWDRTDAWAHGDVVTVKMFGNQAATGAPVVSGTAQVGQTLTLSRSGIVDLDGRTKADGDVSGFVYEYQWIRVDGSDETDISGATSGTYVPVAADVGKKVMVKVSFIDDRSNEEELTSAAYPATGTIVVADSRPVAPSGVTVGAGNKSLVVSWTAVTATPAVTGYKIQYRPAGSSDAWTEWTGTIADTATSETVTGLTEWVSYDVRVLAVNSEGDGAWSDIAAGTAHRDVTLSAAGSVDGVGSDGTTLWATVPGSNIASAYTLSDGTADTDKNITFASGTAPTGICAAHSKVWVAQSNSLSLQAYDIDGTRQDGSDVALPTGTNPVALWCSATFLFVAHDDTVGGEDAVLAYIYNSDSFGRFAPYDVTGLAAADNADPAGLVLSGTVVLVSDAMDDKTYAYNLISARNLLDMEVDFGTDVGTAAGIWADSATLWAADTGTASEIDSFRLPQPADGAPDVWNAQMAPDAGTETELLVGYSELLDGGVIPSTARFTVMAGSTPVTVSSVEHLDDGDGPVLSSMLLKLGSELPTGATVTLSYNDPNPGSNDATGVVQDLDGNDAPSFSGYRVWTQPGQAPAGMSAVPGDAQLALSWDAVADTARPGNTSYVVQYKRSTITDWMTASEASTQTARTIAGLTNGWQYDVRVRASNASGAGPYSAVVSATPSAGPLVEVDAGSADNTFKATDNKSGPTTWHYAWIAGTAVCDSTTTFPDMSNYNEGDNLTYTSTQNTNKACFRSTEGTNSGYAASDVVNTNAASSDATLSALTLVEGSTSVSLSPTFASGTTAYRAWVANGVSSVTVTATKSDDGASVAITGDTDTSTPGTAVLSLEEGANTITVTVTAADTTTTGTYTITAVREASAPTADPTALLTAKMTAGQDGTDDIYGYQRVGANYGALTGNEFDFDGTTETITNLFWNGPSGDDTLVVNRLYLCLRLLPSNLDYDLWTLRVGSDDYRLADGFRVGTTQCVRWARDAAWAHGEVVTVKMFGNHAATGAPGVSGTAQVGQTLTASTMGIADLDLKTKAEAGESGFAYEYQWIRVDSDGTNPVDISGATSVTYVPVKADVGKRVMVKVTFTDDRNNDEELTSAAYPAAGRILNDVPPMLDTATVNGVSLVLTYDRELDGDSDPAVGSYTVTVAGADVTPTGVDAAGRTVTLTLDMAVTSGQSVTLDYEVPDMNPVQDSDGTPAGALDGQAVHNVVGDTTAPTLDSAQVDGDVLVLSYSEALDSGSEPAVGQFDVQVTPSGGSASRRTVSTVDVSGSKVTLTLASAVELDDSVTLSYEKPTSNPLQDVAGNDAAELDDQGVISNNLPMFAQATLTREITENSAANVNVGAPIPAATGGADGTTLEYSMEGTDAASFNFNVTTRQITTKTGVTYDYENKASYEVTINVTDGTDSDTVAVTINVKNLPGFSIAPTYERILLSDGRVQFTLTPDTSPAAEVTRVDYTVTQDEAWLAAANLQGVLDHLNDGASTVNNRSFKPDAPARSGNVTFTLQPGDGYELGATTSATVAIVAADPLITVRATQAAVAVDEDGGTVTVTLRAETIAGVPRPRPPDSPPHRTNWVATGDTATGGGADFQDAGGIALFFEDGFTDQGGRWVATRDVQVTVVDDDTWELDETFHVALSREATLHRLVKLANEDGTLCEDLDADEICGATVTIRASDNTAPVFSSTTATREVAENSPAGTEVGLPVTATDADTGDGDALTYSLLEVADWESFAIDASSGQITTIADVEYDFETDPSYEVTVKATDLQDASATVTVTINLIDVAVEVLPAPLSALSLTGIEFNETFDAGVTAYTASVPHAATRTTVSATPETSGATVTISPADASGSLSGHQVDLDVGDTVITVTVESAGTRSVYSVTVTRSGPEVLSPLDASEELVKSFEMVAGAGNADGVVYGYGAAASGDSLTPTEFEWGGVTYRVTEILVNEDLDHLFVNFDPHPTTEAMEGLNLHIGAVAILGGERYSYWVLQFSRSTRESNNSFSWGFAPAFGPYTNPFGREERAGTTVNLRLVTTETTAPILQSHTVSGDTLVLTYDELLDKSSVPAPSAFVVNVTPDGGTAAQRRSVTDVEVDGVTVTLTLASPVVPGDTITVVYTVPASDPIQDQVGNDAAAINITIELTADQTGMCNRALQDRDMCDLSTATTLTPGVPLGADVDERNDVDWFRVDLEENKVYRIDMEGAPTGKGDLLDPYLQGMYAVFAGSALGGYRDDGLLDGSGEDIETIWYSLHGDCAAGERSPSTDCELFDEGTYYNDDGGVGYNARLYLRDFPTGAHYVEARGLGPATGTYTITLTEVTDDAEGPRTLTLSEETSAVIDFPDDSDTFEIDLTAGTAYTITLRTQGWDGSSDIDIDSAVHTTTPGVVATPYNGKTDTYTITPTTTGTHEIKIVGRNWGRHQRFATGNYTITITG